jgi:hypothetical protein
MRLDYSGTKIIQYSLSPTDSVILDHAVVKYRMIKKSLDRDSNEM